MNWDLIIFDCDGVLVDSEPIANRVFAEEVRKLGIPLSNEEAIAQFPGTTMANCIAYVENKWQVKLPETFVQTFRENSFAAFTKELKEIEGASELVKRLPVEACVASNGPYEKIVHNLTLTNLIQYFPQRLFSAYLLGRFKPEPHLFLNAAETLGHRPERCLVVEDSIHGLEAAEAAGMASIYYSPRPHLLANQQATITALLDLLKWL